MQRNSTSTAQVEERASLRHIDWPARQIVREWKRTSFGRSDSRARVVFIESGAAILTVVDRYKHERFIGMLLPGDVYICNDAPPRHAATTVTDVTYRVLPEFAFHSLIGREPSRVNAYAQNVQQQLDRTRDLFAMTGRKYVVSRLAGLMLWLEDRAPFSHASGRIDFPFRNEDLAVIMGCAREVVSRTRHLLVDSGAITYTRRREIRIIDMPRLCNIRDSGAGLST